MTTHLRNGRQPALNLDSLYGDGPTFAGGPTTTAADMYDGLALKLSESPTTRSSPATTSRVDDNERDLFRDQTLSMTEHAGRRRGRRGDRG